MAIKGNYKHGIITQHRDGTTEIFIPKIPIDITQQPPDTTPTDKRSWSQEQIEERERENIDRSTRRSRKTVKNHVKNNPHTHFVNLTYDFNKYGTNEKRFNRMKNWLKDMRKKHGKFDYCFVPEHHTEDISKGLIHWHGVMNLEKFELIRATDPNTGKEIFDRYGNEVYNLKDWLTTGHTHVTPLRDKKKAANYLTKYITKDIESVVGKGQKKYWSSRGEKPAESYLTEEEALQYLENHTISFENERGYYLDINSD